MNTMTKSNLQSKGFSLLILLYHGHHCRKSGQELKQVWNQAAGVDPKITKNCCFLACFPSCAQPAFLWQPGKHHPQCAGPPTPTTNQGNALA